MLHFLTENQEKEFICKRYEYTDRDIGELAILANSVQDIMHVMTVFCSYVFDKPEDMACSVSVFNALEILMKPITQFLDDACPLAREAAPEKTEDVR
jgi:hypothetical protein